MTNSWINTAKARRGVFLNTGGLPTHLLGNDYVINSLNWPTCVNKFVFPLKTALGMNLGIIWDS